VERLLEVVPGVGVERDVGGRGQHALDLAEAVGHDRREVVVLGHPRDGDEVDLPGDRVDLRDALEVGDLLGDLGDAGDVGRDHHDGGGHVSSSDRAVGAARRGNRSGRGRVIGVRVHHPR
jgi:hypothetical protein